MTDILGLATEMEPLAWQKALFAMFLAFGLGQVVAAVYMATFRGLSYSRATVHGMALGSIVTCMLMLAVSNSIAAGIGIAAGLTAVRFRTTMRDPRDIIFVFAALGVGFASGTHAYAAAIVGTAMFAFGSLVLHFTGYGARRQPDGLLRFVATQAAATQHAIANVLHAHCRTYSLVTLRETAQGTAMEHAYQISARSEDDRTLVVTAMQRVPGVQNVTLLLQEPTLDL